MGAQCGHLGRQDVGDHRDHALPAQRQVGQAGEVVTAVLREARRHGLGDVGRAGHVARRILEAHDARVPRQRGHGVHLQVDDGAAGHVVEHQRQRDGVGLRGEVRHQPLLRGLVVVGHDAEQRIRAAFFGKARQRHRLGRRIGAHAGHDVGAARCVLHGGGQQLAVLGMAQRGAFARGAGYDDAGRAAVDVPVDQAAQRRQVRAQVVGEGREQRHQAAARQGRARSGGGRCGHGGSG